MSVRAAGCRDSLQNLRRALHDRFDALLVELSFGEGVIGFDLGIVPEHHRHCGSFRDAALRRTDLTIEQSQRHVSNPVFPGHLDEQFFVGLRILGQQNDERLQLFFLILLNLLVELRNQRRDLVGCLLYTSDAADDQ